MIGICGGMQMLGRHVHDPDGREGPAGSSTGLGLLDVDTTLAPEKQLRQVSGRLALEDGGATVRGYEIHLGVTTGAGLARPALWLGDNRPDGALSADGQVLATYVHGLFDDPAACGALLRWAGLAAAQGVDLDALREASIERLADSVAAHLDLASMLAPLASANGPGAAMEAPWNR